MNTTIHKRHGASLPHWTREGGIYSVTFRLAGSLPQFVMRELRWEKQDILVRARNMNRLCSQTERMRVQALHEKYERYLDASSGACFMMRVDVAELVADAVRFFDGERYELFAWCVMPNHVHVVLQPVAPHTPSEILHSWKGFTARQANKILGRSGAFWQREYYDHLVRDDEDLVRCVEYVWNNPEEAGLKNWRWRWKKSGV